jgi:hypothetical protein
MKRIIFTALSMILGLQLSFGQSTGTLVSNKPSGGALTLGSSSLFNVNQTTAGQTITVPNPVNSTVGIEVRNVGLVPFTLVPGGSVDTGSYVTLKWVGTGTGISVTKRWIYSGGGSISSGGGSGDIEGVAAGFGTTGGGTSGTVTIGVDTSVVATPYDVSVVQADINSHESNTSNPHSVTKAQVGLGNVDNTSDAYKPISTATQTALNGKQSTITLSGNANTYYNGVGAFTTPSGGGSADSATFATKYFVNTGLATKQATFTSQTKNTVYAGPINGSNATPAFRALTDFDFPLKNRLKYPLMGTPNAFGDSYTAGQQASPSTESYINKLAAINKIAITNNAVGGTGVWAACKAHFTAYTTLGANSATIWMSGFNDLRRSGNNAATFLKIKGCLRSAIINQLISAVSAASAVTNTGSWSNITGIGDKSANGLGGNARQSSTIGNTLTYTSPVSSNVVVGTFNTDGTTYDYGRFTVSIDGTVVQTFNPNSRTDGITDGTYDNGRTQEVLIFEGLANSTHSVVITLLDAKTTVVDYFGILESPYYNMPMFVSSIPKMTTAGYALSPANGSDAIFNAGDVAIQDVINEFPNRPIKYVPLDNYWDPNTGIGADNGHPSNAGYTMIANAFQACIREAIFPKIYKISPLGTSVANTYFSSANNIFRLSSNINYDGVSDNTGLAQAQINITTNNGDSNFQFFTSPTNNTQTLALKITKDGNLEATRNNLVNIKFGASATNSAFFGNNADLAIMTVNRAFDGTSPNTGKSNSAIYLRGVSNAGTIEFYCHNANNTNATMAANLNSSGFLFVGGSSSATSTLQTGGSFAVGYATTAINLTLTSAHYFVNVSATATITLPTAVGITGRVYIVKSSAGTTTMATTSSQTIDGASPTTVTGQLRVISDGANWLSF